MAFTRNKIAIIGTGNTGETIALLLAQKELGDIFLVDIPEKADSSKGKALDLLQSGAVEKFNTKIASTTDYNDLRNSDLVIITAGIPRKTNMSRDDLLETNVTIMQEVAEKISVYAPNSYIIVLSNPVDIMTFVCYKATGFPKNRVIGQSGILDTARFNTFVAEELNISVEDVTGFVLGGHGDEMVPLIRYSSAGGIPLDKLISEERLNAIIERTRRGGGEIVNLLGNGSAYFAPAASVVQMAEVILRDKRRILPAIAYLQGEYGYHDICLGVPTILGRNGIEHIIGLPLSATEKESLNYSAKKVSRTLSKIKSNLT
ncbi:malate dehydrogenase [Pseudogracilibacillus auburnensis]|uniref:Malate dehydrogenase n=1 Tax=Pseudogracilibacillus auburnensis TaxID=1494959 RepID=A0A2V3W899_9BACI|nr:malate dehydrogenase [Pseudogracilibacillus auburnensis]MBO1001670.1 malate dehydrogenase [Pseudogracilibacillus auburnensis]PXW89408.1 malate dehydrogenase (NAD) [Pseudogracilibacillus auburnensis]